jgi:hypothetical protein
LDFSIENIEMGTQSDNRQDISVEKRKEIEKNYISKLIMD